MKKANKKLTLTALLAASAITFAGCGSRGNVTAETETVRETETAETESESQSETPSEGSQESEESVKEKTDDVTRAGGGNDEEELIDFHMEENVNVCVYGPPPEDE